MAVPNLVREREAVPETNKDMLVLFEVIHPADVMFFRRPIEALHQRGAKVVILSRKKDVACDLLDEFGLTHRPVTTAGRGIFGLATELLRRNVAIYREVRRLKPNVLVGFGGTAISHVGKFTGTPSISFYDSENATLQTRLTWPFISHLYVPQSYTGATPEGRTTRIPGTKELSFFHPSAFSQDREIALQAGLDPNHENYFVRIVEWRANHDLGKAGWSLDLLRAVIDHLKTKGVVHISSEKPLPSDLNELAYRGPKNAVHHLMAHCRAVVGESATMASEAAILGVPAIYAGRDFPGYTRELASAGLIWNVENGTEDKMLSIIDAMLAVPKETVVAARDRYVSACPDWSDAVVNAVFHHAK